MVSRSQSRPIGRPFCRRHRFAEFAEFSTEGRRVAFDAATSFRTRDPDIADPHRRGTAVAEDLIVGIRFRERKSLLAHMGPATVAGRDCRARRRVRRSRMPWASNPVRRRIGVGAPTTFFAFVRTAPMRRARSLRRASAQRSARLVSMFLTQSVVEGDRRSPRRAPQGFFENGPTSRTGLRGD